MKVNILQDGKCFKGSNVVICLSKKRFAYGRIKSGFAVRKQYTLDLRFLFCRRISRRERLSSSRHQQHIFLTQQSMLDSTNAWLKFLSF